MTRARGQRGTRKPLTGPDDPRHGTPNAYGHHGCRCDECRKAWRVDVNIRRNHATPPPADDPRHGTGHCYRYYRCRCHRCFVAAKIDRARYPQPRATRGGQ